MAAFLEIDHVSKRFGGLRAINNVSFNIQRDEIAFIVGPNGAGKTTLFNLISGVEHVMQVVMSVAHRVVVLDHGTLIAEGTPEEVVHKPEVIEAYLGTKYKEMGL
jgi:ABC-type branched-subunit amino acid transport system ATPase component